MKYHQILEYTNFVSRNEIYDMYSQNRMSNLLVNEIMQK